MYGAVLWTDRCTKRALIWCEDHGSLAFFDGDQSQFSEAPSFEEGDLVSFKIRDGRGMRVAFEIEIVSSEQYPFLAADLRGMTEAQPLAPQSGQAGAASNILPFTPGRDRRNVALPTGPDTKQAIVKFS
ncbi:hypothetical protein [Roseovarius sp.]|uniref:hypothetical protein n=1 Tax=Roseovarius sp. TaxID=1486281 RepID=UPI003D0BD89A